jgi:rfaE bifunctional protein nucleotidyltransferase chain/domain
MKRVFVNGTFDILHIGHVRLLEFAKSHGEHLLVALDSDRRIKTFKGNHRPVNSLDIRKQMMLSLKPVDAVADFDSDSDLINIIQQYQPHVMVVGSDYKNKNVIGCEHATQLVFFDRIEPYSTSKLVQSIGNW